MRRKPSGLAPLLSDAVPHKVLGLDTSLSSTGYAYQSAGKLNTGRVTTDKLRGLHRLVYLRNQIEKIISASCPTLIVYEDYAMGARGNNMFHIGELGGVLKTLIWEKGIDLLLIPPTTMKSVIAGSGRADKIEIIKALKNRFDLSVNQHDEADATGLMLIGEMLRGVRKIEQNAGESKRFSIIKQLKLTKGKLQSISKLAI